MCSTHRTFTHITRNFKARNGSKRRLINEIDRSISPCEWDSCVRWVSSFTIMCEKRDGENLSEKSFVIIKEISIGCRTGKRSDWNSLECKQKHIKFALNSSHLRHPKLNTSYTLAAAFDVSFCSFVMQTSQLLIQNVHELLFSRSLLFGFFSAIRQRRKSSKPFLLPSSELSFHQFLRFFSSISSYSRHVKLSYVIKIFYSIHHKNHESIRSSSMRE